MKRFLFLTMALALGLAARAQDITSGLIAHYPLNEGSGTTAADLVAGKNGTLSGSPAWEDGGVTFNGANLVECPTDAASVTTNRVTIAAWVRRSSTIHYNTILTKGSSYQLYYLNDRVWFTLNSGGATDLTGNAGYLSWDCGRHLDPNVWVHITATYDGTSARMYFDGAQVSSISHGVAGPSTLSISYDPLTMGTTSQRLSLGNTWDPAYQTYGWRGGLRDVRIYNRALSATDVAKLSSGLPGSYAGLWIGRASLNEVKEAATGNWAAAPAFSETVLMHVDSSGAIALLNEATLMQTRTANPVQLVVTQPALLPNYDGVTLRGGRRIGQRFSSATMLLPSDTLALGKSGAFFSATFTLPAASPVNPFRHKYHPDLGNGRALTRTAGFNFAAGESPSDNTLTGTFMESFSGVHKTTLEARGPITFTRVSTSGKLNQP